MYIMLLGRSTPLDVVVVSTAWAHACMFTGEGLELVRLFYSLLPLRQKWHERSSAATEFLIDETFRCAALQVCHASLLCCLQCV